MSDKDRKLDEELKKLEDEAYFELLQIIAEAMELQDVEILDARIAYWKNKYKKLLDRPSTNSKSDFKKRIEYLLNQYYSSVTQYIFNQLKLKEEKKVENQAKALRELYVIIRDTNDLSLLKKKVEKWKEKYPVDGFLKMYQRRIESYTRQKNLEENAFNQEKAFNDLVDITKLHGTLDELKENLRLWEQEYSINDKYTIDDFIKHQSEVKRFTSDEFLQSISIDEKTPDNVNKNDIDFAEIYNNNSFSPLSTQASAYASLLAISKTPNNINEMFKWVYKNNSIKFNDKYKELILSCTYLDYSPTYLNKITKPKMDMSKSSISYEEYKNINDIKRYAVISYFNLLLPPDKAIANDYFNKNVETVFAKSERARTTKVEDPSISVQDIISSGFEVPLEPNLEAKEKEPVQKAVYNIQPEIVPEQITSETTIEIKPKVVSKEDSVEELVPEAKAEVTSKEDSVEEIAPEVKAEVISKEDSVEEIIPEVQTKVTPKEHIDQEITHEVKPEVVPEKYNIEENFNYDAIVTFSPILFSVINNKAKQAVKLSKTYDIVEDEYENFKKNEITNDYSIDEQIKNKNNID